MLIKFPCQSTHLVLRTTILLPDFQQQDSEAPVGSRNHESAYVAGEFIILAIRFYLASLEINNSIISGKPDFSAAFIKVAWSCFFIFGS